MPQAAQRHGCVVATATPVDKELNCVGTGTEVYCVIDDDVLESTLEKTSENGSDVGPASNSVAITESANPLDALTSNLLLISPFFFWGTAMVAMKGVLPVVGPLTVSTIRLLPAGMLLVAFALANGRKLPSSPMAWFAISLFALVDGAMFQGFLSQGLTSTSAGLGSVIIDSQPITVAILASLLFNEKLTPVNVLGLLLGVVGLTILEVPVDTLLPHAQELALSGPAQDLALSSQVQGLALTSQAITAGQSMSGAASDGNVLGALTSVVADGGVVADASSSGFDLWHSGEWWMFLAAQSMAAGTVMVRWVCKYTDPVMATGWHMILGALPLVTLAALQGEPLFSPDASGHLGGGVELSSLNLASLAYSSLFGSALSYGVFFYNANRGNLTRLSSLTFLTPMFAALFGFLLLHETLDAEQLAGAAVTLVAIYLVNLKPAAGKDKD
eukprot:jgi/Mesvir1/5691/Mv15706-RA.1